MMNKRLLSVIVSVALLLSSISVTGVLMASANGGEATVTTLTAGNISSTLPTDNLLATATKLNSGNRPVPNTAVERLYDGLLHTLNSDDETNFAEFYGDVGVGIALDAQGNEIEKTGGTSQIGYKLSEKMTVKQFVIAGAACKPDNQRVNHDNTYSNAYASAGKTFSGANFDNRNIRYCEIYVSNEEATLYDAASLVYTYDNTTETQLAELITLSTPVDGQFVGFKMSGGYNGIVALTELGIYGTAVEQTGPVITLTPRNIAAKLPTDNLLATATKLNSGNRPVPNTAVERLYDGLLHTLNTDDETNFAEFYGDIGVGIALDAQGNEIEKTGGTSQIGYKLSEKMTIKQFVIAGAACKPDNQRVNHDNTYSNAYASAGKTFSGANFDNRNIRYCEIYVSNEEATLYDAASLVYTYDNTTETQLAELITLTTPVDGQFVGFKMSGGYNGIVALTELGIYGTAVEQTGPVITLTPRNIAAKLPTDNLLATATKLNSGNRPVANTVVENLYDGLLYTLNSDNETNFAEFYGDVGVGIALDAQGNEIEKTGGTSQIGYKLSEKMTIKQFVIAGAACKPDNQRVNQDNTYSTAYASAGKTFSGANFDNRNIRYCEIYVSNEEATLYDAASLVYTYDNKTETQLAELITLTTPVDGQFVGFKMSGGYYGIVALTELGIYGTAVEQTGPVITLTPRNVAAKLPTDNLLATATKLNSGNRPVPNTVLDYLYDGLLYTLNSDNETNFAEFYGDVGVGIALDAQGNEIEKTGGTSQIGYKLSEKMTIKQFVIAGAASKPDNQRVNQDNTYSTAYASAGKTFSGANFDNRNIRYCEIYVSNEEATLYDAASLVYTYDNKTETQLAELITLPTPVDGQFVGFKMSGGYYGIVALTELGVYGSVIDQTGPVITLTPRNVATKLPTDNLLASSTALLSNNKIMPSSVLDYLYDGLLYTLNTDDENNFSEFYGDVGVGIALDAQGNEIEKTGGASQIGYKLITKATIKQFVIAGAASKPDNLRINQDNTYSNAYASVGKTFSGANFDNRNIRYCEIYVSNEEATLYDAASLAYTYYNTTETQLAELITLPTPVEGQFIGFKMSGGYYGSIALTELGVYGDMNAVPTFSYDRFVDESTMNTLINGQENLLLGDKVEGLSTDYLPPSGAAVFANPECLTDDKLGFSATEELQETVYDNSDGSATFYYDLRGEANLSNLLIANHARNTETGKRLSAVILYLGNDMNTLFDTPAGVARMNRMEGGAFISLPANTRARYIGFSIPGGTDGKVHIGELGLYGSYVNENDVSPYPTNLILHEQPVYNVQVPARGIDNKTAVDAYGNPGTGNTGVLNGVEKMGDPLGDADGVDKITDGNTSTFSQIYVNDAGGTSLHYKTQWGVYVYYLGGKSTIEDISLYSTAGWPTYYTTGVQFYAAEKYADLFKNESLLYTTGGERYIVDQENSSEEDGIAYLPDPDYEKSQFVHSYSLSAEQRNKLCRYVAVVVTRPYPRYNPYDTSKLNVGWNINRIGEIIVNGVRKEQEAPVKNTYTASTSKGDVSVTIETTNPDDRPFFEYLDRVQIVEEKLDSSVNKNVYRNWMSVDGETVYHVKLLDKNGNLIALKGDDPDKALNGREMEFHFPPTGDYVQAMGIIEDGVMRQVMNSYTYAASNKVQVGDLDYWEFNVDSNRDLAVLSDVEYRFVYLKMNDLKTINKLDQNYVNTPLSEFAEKDSVAGASASVKEDTTAPTTSLWWLVVLGSIVLASIAVMLTARARKARQSQQ